MTIELAELVIEHSAFVWRVLFHLGVPKRRLEDASQEVFVAMLHALPRFEGRSSLRTWIYGTCRNVARAERRRAREHTEIPTAELPESVVQPAQEGELWIKRAHERLVAALASEVCGILHRTQVCDRDDAAVFVQTNATNWTFHRLTGHNSELVDRARQSRWSADCYVP